MKTGVYDRITENESTLLGRMVEQKSMSARRVLSGQVEIVVNEALGESDIAFVDVKDIVDNAVWQEGDSSKVLVYKGKPVIEMFPIEMAIEGEKVVFTQRYRKFGR